MESGKCYNTNTNIAKRNRSIGEVLLELSNKDHIGLNVRQCEQGILGHDCRIELSIKMKWSIYSLCNMVDTGHIWLLST